MPIRGENKRKHVRLPSGGGSAENIAGEGVERLPSEARVVDISEGGVKLAFEGTGTKGVSLRLGDALSFRLKVAEGGQAFELMSIVRHVARESGGGGRVFVGVEFSGLEGPFREALKGMLLNLAMTKLRTREPEADAISAPGAPPPPRARSLTSRRAPFEAPPPPAKKPEAAPAPAAAGAPKEEHQARRRRMYLGEILVKQGAIASEELQQFLSRAAGDNVPIGQKLISHGLVDDVTIAKALAEQSGLPYLDLVAETPDLKEAYKYPREAFVKHHCVPLRLERQTLLVAMGSRPSPMVIEELELAVEKRVRVGIAAESGLTRWLKKLFNFERPTMFAKARFPVQLRVEYRFLDRERKEPVHDLVAAGITRELGLREMIIAGPLPAGVSPDRIRAESLSMEVQVEGGSLANQMLVGCRPLSVGASTYAGEYHIACYIEAFPEGGDKAWTRLCMALS